MPKKWVIRTVIFKIVTHWIFEAVIVLAITLNTILMGVKWPNMDPNLIGWFEFINNCFTIFFTLECILKLIAFGCRFFKESWNVFDFIIVVVSLVFLICKNIFKVENLMQSA